jgi:hypothetical protein
VGWSSLYALTSVNYIFYNYDLFQQTITAVIKSGSLTAADIRNKFISSYDYSVPFTFKGVYMAGMQFGWVGSNIYKESGHQRIDPSSPTATNTSATLYFLGQIKSMIRSAGNNWSWDETLAYNVNYPLLDPKLLEYSYKIIADYRQQPIDFWAFNVI